MSRLWNFNRRTHPAKRAGLCVDCNAMLPDAHEGRLCASCREARSFEPFDPTRDVEGPIPAHYEEPSVLADFLRDPSLLPKKPPGRK